MSLAGKKTYHWALGIDPWWETQTRIPFQTGQDLAAAPLVVILIVPGFLFRESCWKAVGFGRHWGFYCTLTEPYSAVTKWWQCSGRPFPGRGGAVVTEKADVQARLPLLSFPPPPTPVKSDAISFLLLCHLHKRQPRRSPASSPVLPQAAKQTGASGDN